MDKIAEYNGLKLLSGKGTYFNNSRLAGIKVEHKIFNNILSKISNKKNPIMIELGCYYALWSLLFRQKYPNGKNILIEINEKSLNVGKKNFELNGFDYSSYWGGIFIEDSGNYRKDSKDIKYIKREGKYYNPNTGKITGQELDFKKILFKENINQIDLLHMDIQGSELSFLNYLKENRILNRILNIVIATHNSEIHTFCENTLKENNFMIYENKPFGTMDGDGFLCAIIENNHDTQRSK